VIVRGASVRRIAAAEFFRSRCAGFNTHLYVYAAGPADDSHTGRLYISCVTGTVGEVAENPMPAQLVGCALRRQELASLKIEAIQLREGRWVIIDLHGKGGRIRAVAVPIWVKQGIDVWMTAAKIEKGRLLRPISKSGKIVGDGLGDWAICSIVEQSSKQIGIEHFGAHDLRRTCAKLCRKSGGDLEQIKFLLGHSSIQTTERYLGSEQEIAIAVNDSLGL
jgi:integrase